MRTRLSMLLIIITALGFSLTSCNNKKTEDKTTTTGKDSSSAGANTTTPDAAKDTAKSTTKTIKAKYTGFSFGDAAHFIFTDEAGKTYDFAEVDDYDVQLIKELPEKEANTTNQGWEANKDMLNKWYNVTYRTNMQPQYEGGPIAEALIIVTATPAG